MTSQENLDRLAKLAPNDPAAAAELLTEQLRRGPDTRSSGTIKVGVTDWCDDNQMAALWAAYDREDVAYVKVDIDDGDLSTWGRSTDRQVAALVLDIDDLKCFVRRSAGNTSMWRNRDARELIIMLDGWVGNQTTGNLAELLNEDDWQEDLLNAAKRAREIGDISRVLERSLEHYLESNKVWVIEDFGELRDWFQAGSDSLALDFAKRIKDTGDARKAWVSFRTEWLDDDWEVAWTGGDVDADSLRDELTRWMDDEGEDIQDQLDEEIEDDAVGDYASDAERNALALVKAALAILDK